MILAIDPGTTESAFVVYDSGILVDKGKIANEDLLKKIKYEPWHNCHHMAIEMISSYGMPVGREVFETCVWIGRFIEAWGGVYNFVYRKDVKMHLCNSTRAKDANIRQSLIDLYGGSRAAAIGKKASPGPLYGVSNDIWAALGVAVTFDAGI